jgi:hypothetical protein
MMIICNAQQDVAPTDPRLYNHVREIYGHARGSRRG